MSKISEWTLWPIWVAILGAFIVGIGWMVCWTGSGIRFLGEKVTDIGEAVAGYGVDRYGD